MVMIYLQVGLRNRWTIKYFIFK